MPLESLRGVELLRLYLSTPPTLLFCIKNPRSFPDIIYTSFSTVSLYRDCFKCVVEVQVLFR